MYELYIWDFANFIVSVIQLICVNEIFIFEFFIAMYVYDDYNDTNLTNSFQHNLETTGI